MSDLALLQVLELLRLQPVKIPVLQGKHKFSNHMKTGLFWGHEDDDLNNRHVAKTRLIRYSDPAYNWTEKIVKWFLKNQGVGYKLVRYA